MALIGIEGCSPVHGRAQLSFLPKWINDCNFFLVHGFSFGVGPTNTRRISTPSLSLPRDLVVWGAAVFSANWRGHRIVSFNRAGLSFRYIILSGRLVAVFGTTPCNRLVDPCSNLRPPGGVFVMHNGSWTGILLRLHLPTNCCLGPRPCSIARLLACEPFIGFFLSFRMGGFQFSFSAACHPKLCPHVEMEVELEQLDYTPADIHRDHTPDELEGQLGEFRDSRARDAISVCPSAPVKSGPHLSPDHEAAGIEPSSTQEEVKMNTHLAHLSEQGPKQSDEVASLDKRNFPPPTECDAPPSPTLPEAVVKPHIHPFDTRQHYNPIDTSHRLIAITVEHVAAAITETWMMQSSDCMREIRKSRRTQWGASISFSYLGHHCPMYSPLYLFYPKFIRRAKLQAAVLHELSAPPPGIPTSVRAYGKVAIFVFNISTSRSANFFMRRNGRLGKLAEYISYEWQQAFEYSPRDRFFSLSQYSCVSL